MKPYTTAVMNNTKSFLLYCLVTLISLPVLGQSLVDVSPSVGTQGETLTLTISGQSTHFQQASYTSVTLRQGTSTVIFPEQTTVLSDEEIDATFNFGYMHNLGWYEMRTWNELDGELTLENAFYLYGTPTPPELVSIEPNEGTIGQELEVTISGQYTHFQASTTMVYFKQGTKTISADSQEMISPTQVNAHFTFDQNDDPGIYDVVTWDPFDGTLILPEAFTLQLGIFPSISFVDPSIGMVGTEFVFLVYGENTHFAEASILEVTLEDPGSYVVELDVEVLTNELLQCTTVLPYNGTGYLDLFVWSSEDGQIVFPEAILAYPNPDTPQIISFDPQQANVGDHIFMEVETEHTWFDWVEPQVWMLNTYSGYSIDAGSVEVIDNNNLLVEFTISDMAPAGYYDLNTYDIIHGYLSVEGGFMVNDTIIGIRDTYNKTPLNLYPNPTTGRFKLNSSKQINNCDIVIYNLVGQKKEFKNVAFNHNQTLNVNIESFSDGLYFVKIITEEEIFVKKIIKQ